MKSVFHRNRRNIGLIVLVMMVVVVLLSAGCSSQKSEPTAPAAGSPQGAASVAPAGTAAAAAPAGGTCSVLNGKGAWDGKWKGKIGGVSGRRADLRECFYPPTKDNPDPWEDCGWSPLLVDIEFSQTGCDVNGKMTTTDGGCPVTVTGKAEGTSVKGTWKAYCDLGTAASGITDELGSFSLWMEPTGVSFIGAFDGSSPAAVESTKDAVAEGLNSNFAGKRA